MKQPMKKDIFICNRFIIMRNSVSTPQYHSHHAIEFLFNARGDSKTYCEDHDHRGEFIIINRQKRHTIETDAHSLVIFINPETFEGRALRKFIRDSPCYTVPHLKTCVKKILMQIYNCDFTDETLSPLITELIFHQVDGNIEEMTALDSRIESLLKGLSRGELTGLKGKELSSRIFLSESRFQHLFKENTGITLSGYLLWFKTISAMKSVLTGKNITSAAMDAGFSDSAHFSRTFKKSFGLNPKTLLNLYKKVNE